MWFQLKEHLWILVSLISEMLDIINQNLQGNEEVINSSQKPLASQEAKQEDQRAKSRDARKEKREKKLITHKKNKFQDYLIKKGLNYLSKGKQEEGTDLQICLSAYTDLDVLDKDNKFICQACTR